jgi:branched-chain amino acid transport system permease protein
MIELVLQQVVNGVVLGSTYTLVALGLTLIYGILEIVNFAHGEFYMIGAFMAFLAVTRVGLPYPAAIAAAAAASAVFGYAVERLLIRPLVRRAAPPIAGVLLTVSLSTFLVASFAYLFGSDLQQIPSPYVKTVIRLGAVFLTAQRLVVLVVAVALIAVLAYVVKYTSLGRQMRAAAQNLEAARIVGVPIDRVFGATFMIGAALAGIAGALVGAMFVVEPTMGLSVAVKAFVVVIVGGMGSIAGSIVAGFGLALVETLAGALLPAEFIDIVAFSAMILVLLTRPTGLFGAKVVRRA